MMDTQQQREYLNRHGNLRVPCSRYGRNTFECTEVALSVVTIWAPAVDDHITGDMLDFIMDLVVDNDDDIAHMLENYVGVDA